MRHAVRLPLLSLRVDMLRLTNTLPLLGHHYYAPPNNIKIEEYTYQYSSAVSGTIYMLLRHIRLCTLLCHTYHSTMWPTVVVLYLDLARITHCCSAAYCVCVKDSASAVVSTLQA